MAKDPAVLFYTQDFLVGVSLFTPLQKGHYITLLCHQQQSETGSLSLEAIITLMGRDFEKQWVVLKKKFKEDENGFYNERMRKEIARRKQNSEKQKAKVDKRWADKRNQSDTTVSTAVYTTVDTTVIPNNGNTFLETETEIETDLGKGLQGENLFKPPEYFFDKDTSLPYATQEAAERNQFAMTRNTNADFVKEQWIVFLLERLAEPPDRIAQYRSLSDLTSYFLNWIRNKKPNETNQGFTTAKSSKPGTSEARTEALKNWRIGG